MSAFFPLGLLTSHEDIMRNAPAEIKDLLKKDWFGGLSLSFCYRGEEAHLIMGTQICQIFPDKDTCDWSSELATLKTLDGAMEAIAAFNTGYWLSPYILQNIWANTYENYDGSTYVNVLLLPSGIVMGVEDPGTTLEDEFNELEGSLASEDEEELLYQMSENGFPTHQLASIVIPKDRLTSGHEQLRTIQDLAIITEEWKRTLRDDRSGMGFLTKVPFTPPTLR